MKFLFPLTLIFEYIFYENVIINEAYLHLHLIKDLKRS